MTESKREKRYQLVVSLGLRTEGLENRRALERAAQRAKLELSVWSRRVLLAAAGVEDQEFATRADVLQLVERLERLEDKLGIDGLSVLLDPEDRHRRYTR